MKNGGGGGGGTLAWEREGNPIEKCIILCLFHNT